MTVQTLERLPITELSALDGTKTRLSGVATLYDTRIPRGLGLQLEIAPGSFSAASRDPGRVKLLWQHDHTAVIGHLTRMWDDTQEGQARLMIEAKINPDPAVPEARRFVANYEHGDLAELSVGFEWLKWESWDETGDDGSLLTVVRVTKARLLEVSAVTFGAVGETASVSEMLQNTPSGRMLAAEAAKYRARMHAHNH